MPLWQGAHSAQIGGRSRRGANYAGWLANLGDLRDSDAGRVRARRDRLI
jgi:hypothetical protein